MKSLFSLLSGNESNRLLSCKTAYRYMMHIEDLRGDPALSDAQFRERCGWQLRPALLALGDAFPDCSSSIIEASATKEGGR